MAAPVEVEQKRFVLRARTAGEMMSPNPMSLRSDRLVEEAVCFLVDKGFSAAPVIDDAGRPVGVLSRTDILAWQREKSDQRLTLVSDIMTPVVFSLAPTTPAHEVIRHMLGLQVHQLFVVDEDGILIGVITALDVLRKLEAEDQ